MQAQARSTFSGQADWKSLESTHLGLELLDEKRK